MSVGPIPDRSSVQITHAIKNSSYAGYPLLQASPPKQNVMFFSYRSIEMLQWNTYILQKRPPSYPVPNPHI